MGINVAYSAVFTAVYICPTTPSPSPFFVNIYENIYKEGGFLWFSFTYKHKKQIGKLACHFAKIIRILL